MDDSARSGAQTQLQRERDLYLSLLELGTREELEPFVAEALALIVSVTRAQRGYLELFDERDEPSERDFWVHGCSADETPGFRAGISQGVIAEVLSTRKTRRAKSALNDPQLGERASVQRLRIQAVLCVPIIAGNYLGVIYLQRLDRPDPFSDDDERCAETFARHIAAFADRLLLRRRMRRDGDPTLPFRKKLQAAELVGASESIARVLKDAVFVAEREIGVLILGATGTGKSMLAHIIHKSSRRRGLFVELNCAALPDALFESELFGALPGAHSTANRKVEGKVAAATGGTLFLDEVGELSLVAQAKLLQLLQNKEYFPLGSAHPLKADVRIIAATNGDLTQAIANKTFREDLLYRLYKMPIRMPSLAERPGDIPELVRRACMRACEEHGLGRLRVSPAALHAAQTTEWPGNVRQLLHAVETAAIRASGESVLEIEPRHLFPDRPVDDTALSYQEQTRRFQRQLVRTLLDEVGWNVSEAARRLDLGRTYLHKLIASFGLTRGGR